MSAWYILRTIGFYSIDPVSGNYVFGTPLFDRVTVQLGQGKQFEIVAHRKSPADQYIQSVSFNGEPYTNGARIVFEMGSEPNLEFGTRPADVPPSLTRESAQQSSHQTQQAVRSSSSRISLPCPTILKNRQ